MKTHFTLTLLLLFFISNSYAQEKPKDTLFFAIDKYYTISPTITSNFSNIAVTYPDKVELMKVQMKHTKTNGNIYFIGDGFLTKGLKPKKILSIKDFIENRKFYCDGIYNKIVDDWKIKDSLTDKYKIFFVYNDQFIEPRYLEYQSYYPLRDKDWNVINNKVKDTLFFKLDNKYIQEPEGDRRWYYLNDSSDSDSFVFIEEKIIHDLKPKKILPLKEYVRSSRFYDENNVKHLKDYYLAKFLNNYIIFLVKENNKKIEYIEVSSSYGSLD